MGITLLLSSMLDKKKKGQNSSLWLSVKTSKNVYNYLKNLWRNYWNLKKCHHIWYKWRYRNRCFSFPWVLEAAEGEMILLILSFDNMYHGILTCYLWTFSHTV